MKFKVIFYLDGSGIHYDPNEPLHLDALLTWALAPRQGVRPALTRDDPPEHVDLPLLRQHFAGGLWCWRASALLPEGPLGEDLQFWRCRFRQGRADLSTGSPNLTNGTWRDWNMPMPLLLTRRLVAYAEGNRKECRRLLAEVRFLGKKRAYGCGRVVGLDLLETAEDWSIARDGLAMRWQPDESGTRRVRLRPPYWNRVDRVTCCEVGDPVELRR